MYNEEDSIIKNTIKRQMIKEILLFNNSEENIIDDKKEEVLFKLIPELICEIDFDQRNNYHIYDVWNHTLKALKKSEKDLEIRLAVLLHDIGKPESCKEDENGTRHFPGHAGKSAEIAERVLTRLGYDGQQKNNILYLIKNHATPINVEEINKSNIEQIKKLLHVQYCDAYAYNPKYTPLVIEKLDKTKEKINIIEEKNKEKGEER